MMIHFNSIISMIIKSNMFYPNAKPTCYEIVYYKTGQGQTRIGSSYYKFSKGTYAVVSPNDLREEIVMKDTEIISLTIKVDKDTKRIPSGLYYDVDNKIFRFLDKLFKEYDEKSEYSHDFLNIYSSELYFTILRNISETYKQKDKIEEIVDYIDEYYNEDIKVDELAKMAGYSCRHFRNLFIEKTGLPPFEFLLKKRIEQSKSLLMHTDNNILSISECCGFSSSSQFAMLFKRYTGMTPKNYRTTYSEMNNQ